MEAEKTMTTKSLAGATVAEVTLRRHGEIIDRPPRISPSSDPEVVKAAQRHVASLMTTGGQSTPVDPDTIDASAIPEMILSLMGCHPDLYEKVAAVSVALMAQSRLPRRDLELVVLRTDWLCQAPYNWGEHVAIAKRFGVTSEEIERVTLGSEAPGWNDHERALLRAAEEIHGNAMISDETWATLAATFSDDQMFELIVLVGQFTLVTGFQNSLRFRLAGNAQGLLAR